MRTLLDDIEDFLKAYPEVLPSHLARQAIGDAGLVRQLRNGRSPRESTVAVVRAWMVQHANAEKLKTAQRSKLRRRIEAMPVPLAG